MRWFAIAAAAVLVSGCAVVRPHDHVGVHFHADIGIIGSSTSNDFEGVHEELSGAGGAFSVAAGGAVAPNVIVGGEIWGTAVSDPDVTDIDGTFSATGTTYSVFGIGPTIKYYLMPANVFFSATPSFTRWSWSDDSSDASLRSKWGLGLRASVGKEWQVVGGWGMGVAGVLDVSSNKDADSGYPARWGTLGGGVVFSASFN